MIRAKSAILISAVAVLGLSACTTGPLVNENDPNQKAKQGALVGAIGGAVAGRLLGGNDKGERNRATVAGALVGAGVGAAIGNQLDKQEAELRQQLGDSATIRNTGDRLIVTMPQDILFAKDSADLRPTLVSDLRDVGQSLLAYPNTTAQVIGHTDSDGDAAYNLDLSQRRARSVANVLLSEGVSSARVSVIGRGEDQPIASNLTAEGKAQNRRVEIVILPTG
ncbi:OmpA family protein [Mameliella sediminis]|uniref:OmpA family protein n=1 Tax=Mameliella sediminis TaxID=2836866 RepID=UPI001C45DC43|nr:OmpA family protein [Mameliella sediminis]MBY6113808.1 OmpA family protein [Antarctobacter heliothermus]MBY6142844.1 OmpA family protein [Mameliella alba]MBV7395105.1 OmpA family protein [Mameliella sediminis]MBY6159699.1 OmpA family protein [Mameliella alba]MBY6168170.1 OmpA family protein [Mameliella alba]